MAEEEISHRTEIRHGRRTAPAVVALALGGTALAVVVVGRGGGPAEPGPTSAPLTTVVAPPTSETLTTTSPPTVPPPVGLAVGGVPAAAEVVTTDGLVVVRTPDGDVLAAGDGEAPVPVVSGTLGLHPSNEPGHVWIETEDEVELVEVRGGGTVTELPTGDARVLGPASFGVVTVDGDGTVRWHRPSFEPTVVELPDDRTAVDAGGELVLAETPSARPGSRRLELWRVADGRFWQSFEVAPGVEGGGVLAPTGSHVAVPDEDGWTVRDATTTYEVGTLPAGPTPVWLGWRRFGAVHDAQALISDGTTAAPGRTWLALAEQSPSLRS